VSGYAHPPTPSRPGASDRDTTQNPTSPPPSPPHKLQNPPSAPFAPASFIRACHKPVLGHVNAVCRSGSSRENAPPSRLSWHLPSAAFCVQRPPSFDSINPQPRSRLAEREREARPQPARTQLRVYGPCCRAAITSLHSLHPIHNQPRVHSGHPEKQTTTTTTTNTFPPINPGVQQQSQPLLLPSLHNVRSRSPPPPPHPGLTQQLHQPNTTSGPLHTAITTRPSGDEWHNRRHRSAGHAPATAGPEAQNAHGHHFLYVDRERSSRPPASPSAPNHQLGHQRLERDQRSFPLR